MESTMDEKVGHREPSLAEAETTASRVSAAAAIQQEHNMTFTQTVKLYPKAIAWSAFVSIGVIMLSFDPQLIGNLYATPKFAQDFGYQFQDGVSRPC
jgi:hypothetical protein